MELPSATEVFREWYEVAYVPWCHRTTKPDIRDHNANSPYEFDTPSGLFIIWSATLDFDYEMGYMLEVRYNEGDETGFGTSDYIFGWRTPHPDKPELQAEWAGVPHKIFGPEHPRHEATRRFVDWVFDKH